MVSLGSIFSYEIVVVLIPTARYIDRIIDVTKICEKKAKKLCYVSINKSTDSLLPLLQKKKVHTDKMLFIDAVAPRGQKNVIAVSSPRALTETNIAITEAMEHRGIDALLFDSLSTLLVYERADMVIKFSHSIISKARDVHVRCVFTLLKEDVESELVKDLSMFVDKVITI